MNRKISITVILVLTMSVLQEPTIAETFMDMIMQRANNMINGLGVRRTLSDINEAGNGRLLVTDLDRFRGLFVLGRHLSLWQAHSNIDDLNRDNRRNGKMQPIIPDNVPFPCYLNNTRSEVPPTSVHQLRPGDIDIIASFGDSLTAGNGVVSTTIVHILNEYRGLVFSGGGIGTWRSVLTLPNILKVFNPNLYGYSIADGLVVDRVSHLNIAEPMLMSRDLPYQARVFVSRLRRDPHVNMQHHWKLLTIFIGCNDLCSDMCHHERIEEFVGRHERDLRQTFTILRDQVPRLLINLIPAPNMVTTLYAMKNVPLSCQAVHSVGCHCVFSERYNATYLQKASENIHLWQKAEEHIASLPEFQTDDFAVIYHPFLENPPLKTLRNGDTDFRYFASDCFHFSQLGQAGMANSLWNSMLQPVGQKQLHITQAFEYFECPTETRPYIATIRNS